MDIEIIVQEREKRVKKETKNKTTFDAIASIYPNILLDTSVLIGSLKRNKEVDKYELFHSCDRYKVKRLHYSVEAESINLFCKTMNNYQFCTTEKVLNEIEIFRYKFKRAIKSKFDSGNRELLELRRAIRDTNRIKRNLISKLVEEGRILKLNESEQELYGLFYKKYFKTKELRELSETDFELLVSGLVMCKKRDPTALISNDFQILHGWREILKEENENLGSFGFYLRADNTTFRKAK